MAQDQTFISATLSLANGALRATLLLEVSLAHPSFCRESPLSDLRKNAEENFPIVLAQVAPQPLRQILEKAEGLLLSRSTEDLTSGDPLFKKMYPEQFAEKKARYVFSSGRPDFMTDDDRKHFWAEACKEIAKHYPEKSFINEAQASVGTASDAEPAKKSFDEILRQWASRQEGGFSMLDALTKGLGLSEDQATPAICTRVGIALKRLGCTSPNRVPGADGTVIYFTPPRVSGSPRSPGENDSPPQPPELPEPVATPLAMQEGQGPAQQPQALSVSLGQAALNPSAPLETQRSAGSPAR